MAGSHHWPLHAEFTAPGARSLGTCVRWFEQTPCECGCVGVHPMQHGLEVVAGMQIMAWTVSTPLNVANAPACQAHRHASSEGAGRCEALGGSPEHPTTVRPGIKDLEDRSKQVPQACYNNGDAGPGWFGPGMCV